MDDLEHRSGRMRPEVRAFLLLTPDRIEIWSSELGGAYWTIAARTRTNAVVHRFIAAAASLEDWQKACNAVIEQADKHV